MKNRDLLKMFYSQDSRWADIATSYLQAKDPAGKAMKHFLDTDWSRVVTHAREVATRDLDKEVTPSVMNEILSFAHYSLYPAALAVGFPDTSFVWPDITLDAQESASNYYSIPTFLSGESMRSIDSVPPDFRARCCAKLTRDNVLTVKCDLGDGPAFERTVDLNPYIQMVHQKMVDWHRAEHGDVSVSGIGDLFSDAVNAVTSVYTNKSVQSLFDTVAPIALSAAVPGGTQTLALALKAKDILVDAKNGNPHAVQTIADVHSAATNGNDQAAQLLDILTKLNAALNQKASNTKVSGFRVSGTTDHRSGSGSSGSGSKPVGGLLGFTPVGWLINQASKGASSSNDHRSNPGGGWSPSNSRVVNAPGTGVRRPGTPTSSSSISSITTPGGTPVDPTGQYVWVTDHWERKSADPVHAAQQTGQYPIDPSTGLSYDPATGNYVDPTTGYPLPDPSQGYGYGYPDPSQGYGAAPYYGPAPSPYGYPAPAPYPSPYGYPAPAPAPYPSPYGYGDPYAAAYGYGAPMVDPSTGLPYGANPNPYGWPTGPGAGPMDYSHIPGHVPGDDYGGAGNPYGYQFSGWGYNRPYRAAGGAGSKLRALYNLGAAL